MASGAKNQLPLVNDLGAPTLTKDPFGISHRVTTYLTTGDGPVSPKTWSKQRHGERSRRLSASRMRRSVGGRSRPSGRRSLASVTSLRRLLTAITLPTKSQPSSSVACIIGRTVATPAKGLDPTKPSIRAKMLLREMNCTEVTFR